MATQIHFGTSGWRAVMAEEFTFANVRRAVTGIARYVVSQKPSNARVIVGRDPRFLGETFCSMASEILIAHGITPLMIAEAAPTPAISYAVIQEKADGAINFTASHNPPEYNGIKFSTPDGAPALPEVTERIEAEIAASDSARDEPKPPARTTTAQALEPRSAYLARLREIVDLKAIQKANLRVVFDPFWGAARGYSDALLREAGVDVSTVHDCRDVLFGGHAPEPDDHLLEGCRERMRATNANIGIATDGDADRFGIVDAAVGFKYIGELIKQDKIAIGGEESAGLSIRHHVPEKDGVLAGLLCCEMVAKRGKSLGQQLQDLFAEVGSFYSLRENFRLTQEVKEKFTGKLQKEPRDMMGRKVSEVVRTDGLKLLFADGSWVCYRLSGTEPVVRVYSEARSKQELEKLSAAAKQWIFE